MKTVIVPVDFSANAANAAAYAGRLAAFYGAELWLYHAYELPVVAGDIGYPVFDMDEMQQAAEHDMQMFKESVSAGLGMPLKINVKSDMNILKDGLEGFCNELQPALVVMGLSGNSTLTRLIVGSNTIRTIYELKYPVLIVPPKATFTPVRKIGFACDYKEIMQSTPLDLLKRIVKDFNADLYVLNVDYQNRNFVPSMLEESFTLGQLLKDLQPQYHNIHSEEVTSGINWFAEKEGLEMIVVVPKKHHLVHRMFMRSHSKDLLFHTHIPVLCIHQ